MIYDHQLYPIGMPSTDWATYTQIMKKVFNQDPSKGIDRAKLSALTESIRKSDLVSDGVGDSLHHTNISFLFVTNHPTPMSALDFKGNLHVSTLNHQLGGYSAHIITGDLRQWYCAILVTCNREAVIDTRLVGNVAYTHLRASGLSELWENYSRQQLEDQTFILKRKR